MTDLSPHVRAPSMERHSVGSGKGSRLDETIFTSVGLHIFGLLRFTQQIWCTLATEPKTSSYQTSEDACLSSSYIMNGVTPNMPSPPASRSESTAPRPSDNLQALIIQLRDNRDGVVREKERLVAEKDALVNEKLRLVEDRERAVVRSEELLSSMTALWQKFHDAVGSRDEEIAKLKEDRASLQRELGVVKKQNKRLARTLDEFLEKDEDEAEPNGDPQSKDELQFQSGLEAEPVPRARKQERTSCWLENVPQPDEMMTGSRSKCKSCSGLHLQTPQTPQSPSTTPLMSHHPRRQDSLRLVWSMEAMRKVAHRHLVRNLPVHDIV